VKAQTKDGQQIDISYTVLFSMPEGNDVTRVLETIGDMDLVVENVVKANSRSLTRLFAQSFDADDLYSGDSIFAFSAKVENGGNVTIAGDTARIKGLKEELEEVGVKFDQFLLRKIDFDTDYVQAIENKRIAFENITTQENNALAAEFEKQRTIREKEAEAQGVVLNAQAEAEQTRLAADAEAYAIEQKGGALRRNPEVLQWEMVGNLSGAKWIMPFDSVEQFIPVDILSEE
jgi:regulator of protease activity HflC (stomatin/prohibitin superfamily)